ncbi:hypothetical protein UlMin_043909 [Ulmus minor]
MSWSAVATVTTVAPLKKELSRLFYFSASFTSTAVPSSFSSNSSSGVRFKCSSFYQKSPVIDKTRAYIVPFSISSSRKQICKAAAEYKFPDPIPEFAEAETEKFRAHLLKRLSKKEIYEDSVEDVVDVCTEIFNTFLHTEYGGPGTLMVVPFIDMADTVHERGFPGASQAARVAVKWAQKHVDNDWKEWTGTD